MENRHVAYGAEYAFRAEKIVSEIFEAMGYSVVHEIRNELCYDFLAEKDGVRYVIEVKASRTGRVNPGSIFDAARRLRNYFEHAYFMGEWTAIPAIVVIGIVDDRILDALKVWRQDFQLLDIRNLLYMVEENESLRNKLVSLLPFSVEGVHLEKPNIGIAIRNDEEPEDIWGKYIHRLRRWEPKSEKSESYEHLCSDILKDLFADDLTKWQTQKSSNDGLFRFDAIAKIKRGNNKEFWETAERYYNSKYVVFEYKNYSDKITQAQVYTTVRYLYATALRRVAILISTNGADDHANVAIRGILRDEGKLIIALSNEDLIAMLEMKQRKEEPADYLSDKLDELLIDLEK